MYLTNRQPSNAGGFRRLAVNKPINDKGKGNIQQVNPALQVPAGRYAACLKKDCFVKYIKKVRIFVP
jgi:hypothetical protein